MIEGMQVKICGLTLLADAKFAAASGAGFLGFVLHPKSPRYLSLEQFRELAPRLPDIPKVAVSVEPAPGSLKSMKGAGFDFFQVHFRHDIPVGGVAAWAEEVGAENLWLAPKLPPGVDLPASLGRLSRTVLLDTFDPNLFGGTGRTGDWPKFRRHSEAHRENTWILSGGLNPENIADAIAGTGARFVDVNSGIESSPGVKDHARLSAFIAAVGRASGR